MEAAELATRVRPARTIQRILGDGSHREGCPIPISPLTTDDGLGELAKRLREGDASALEALYERVGRRAFGLAYRVLGDGGSAEDAVQEAFIALWRQSARIDVARGRVDSLLLTIVHRRAVDLVRARRGQPARTLDGGADLVDWHAADALDAVADAVAHEQIVRALEDVPAEQRSAIELAYFGGMTHTEIASSLGVPVGTVKSRLRLGLARVRNSLGVGGGK